MPEKQQGMWTRLFTDYRVIILIIALLLSIIFLGPSYSNGQLNTNLKFGLDFEGGSYVKLKLLNNSSPGQPISDQTLELTKSIMELKINEYGLKNTPVNTVRDDQGNAYVLIDFAGIPYDEAMSIVGRQGKFEMRIQTQGNESAFILDGSDVTGVSDPVAHIEGTETAYGVTFGLTKAGAEKFQQACIKYGATADPESHYVMMLLDGKVFYSRPLSSELANSLKTKPVDQMEAMTGTGDEGKAMAKEVSVHMRGGSLPVSVQVVSSGQVPAEQGAMFKTVVIIAMILAQCAIGAIMYFRYREPRIILPMFLTSIFEVVILLGVAAFINWEIDLPSVAGIIAVIGTGIDQLIIITDEVMTTGKAPTTKKILQKLSSAFKIIVSSAATVVVAMIPLWYMGFGSLKGFAITTILGVFIGILITRPAYGRIISDILGK
ncbi:Preprotein translocase subunit SecD [Methanocella conradii HZ254]|uniref:Protein-export membrane protein SecD n=1 Tax=Methanocella conradii (strain DSM 24694 / JCM 17849 / CGMCC 1.5162 / HZ254) TaxID=1041930 RepID=H8I931_METCZ|nr:preprotein translocase subunit SecD [Methanocella conradii]AFC99034.1 Preprotein translocase subunit SecD [Methanocella conradii HZ254]